MGKLTVYNFVSLNGFFKGPNEDVSWSKNNSKEQSEFAAKNAKSGNILLFGRKTYEMMAGYWPTPQASKQNPEVAEGMNKAEKIVFSRTLKKADWDNTRILSDNIVEEIKKLKKAGKNMTILGSGSIVNLCTENGLVDEYQIMVYPVVLGKGTPIFDGIAGKKELKLSDSKEFDNGVVLHSYEMA